MAATTIQVKDDVLEMLNRLKMDKSYFGRYPRLESFQRKEIDRFDCSSLIYPITAKIFSCQSFEKTKT
jgi:hypothetical protein